MSGKRDKPYGGKLSALDTLFGGAPEAAAELIPIGQIKVQSGQPRHYFGDDEMRTLVTSVREHGILQPILARPLNDNTFELVAGERRLRAATEVGLAQVPVVVREMSEEQAGELALLENLQRENLNPIEETDAVLAVLATRLKKSVPEVFDLLRQLYDEGRGRSGNNVVSTGDRKVVKNLFTSLGRFSVGSFYTHRLPLLRLPKELLEVVRTGRLEYTKARELARVRDTSERRVFLERVLEAHMSLAEIRAHIATVNGANAAPEPQQDLVKRIQGRLAPPIFTRLPTKTQKEAIKLLGQLDRLLKEGS